jgi:hypothetical protein
MKAAQEPVTSQGDQLPLDLPETITYECACIYNIDGKCMGMLAKERLSALLAAYDTAKEAGWHNTIHPCVQDPATEIMGLLQRAKAYQKTISSSNNKVHISNTLLTPAHIRLALQKWCLVTTDRFSSPLHFDPAFAFYYSKDSRDQVFGAHHGALTVQFCGHSFCHPPHDDEVMSQCLRHAVHSSLQTDRPVATFILLPHWKGFSRNAYISWLNAYPNQVKVLAKFPAGSIKFEAPQHWFDTLPAAGHAKNPMQLIVVWNQIAVEALDNANTN